MFGPGVSTMPNETRAKPSSEVRWGMAGTRGESDAQFYPASGSDAISKIGALLIESFKTLL